MDKEKEGLNSTEDQKNVDASVSWLQMTQSWKIEQGTEFSEVLKVPCDFQNTWPLYLAQITKCIL